MSTSNRPLHHSAIPDCGELDGLRLLSRVVIGTLSVLFFASFIFMNSFAQFSQLGVTRSWLRNR